MEGLIKGDVVVAPIPYSDFSQQKVRPVLILAVSLATDLIVCRISTQRVRNPSAISITNADFVTGTLRENSNVYPDKILTIDRRLIEYKIGTLNPEKVEEVIKKLVEILEQ